MVRKKYLQFTSTMLVLLADQASCEAETTPGSFIVAFETLLAIGIFVSWVPQQVEFIRTKRTFGVSGLYIVLTQIANWTPFISAMFLDYEDFACCQYLSFWKCQETLLDIYQLASSTLGVFLIYVFFVVYYDPTDPDAVEAVDREIFTPGSSGKVINEVGERDTDAMLSGYDDYSLETSVEETSKGKRRQFLYFVLFHLGVIVVISVGVIMMLVTGPSSTEVVTYADALGIISSLIVFAQFTPQIYVTWKLKTAGSLSVVMLLIQAPGTWVWFVSLVFQEHWAVWMSTLVAAIEVSILLSQVIYYDYILGNRKGRSSRTIAESDEIF